MCVADFIALLKVQECDGSGTNSLSNSALPAYQYMNTHFEPC